MDIKLRGQGQGGRWGMITYGMRRDWLFIDGIPYIVEQYNDQLGDGGAIIMHTRFHGEVKVKGEEVS